MTETKLCNKHGPHQTPQCMLCIGELYGCNRDFSGEPPAAPPAREAPRFNAPVRARLEKVRDELLQAESDHSSNNYHGCMRGIYHALRMLEDILEGREIK